MLRARDGSPQVIRLPAARRVENVRNAPLANPSDPLNASKAWDCQTPGIGWVYPVRESEGGPT